MPRIANQEHVRSFFSSFFFFYHVLHSFFFFPDDEKIPQRSNASNGGFLLLCIGLLSILIHRRSDLNELEMTQRIQNFVAF